MPLVTKAARVYKYYFYPHLHWNEISEEVYAILALHYGADRLKKVWIEKE